MEYANLNGDGCAKVEYVGGRVNRFRNIVVCALLCLKEGHVAACVC